MLKNRFFGRITLPLMAAGAIATFAFTGNSAQAASFGHVHTSDCYKTVTGTCNNYHIKDVYQTNTYHCTQCQVMTTHKEIVYWDICDSGLSPARDIAYYQECSRCGHVRKDENPDAHHHTHTFTTTQIACGKTENTAVANVSLSMGDSSFTNGSVTLNADVNIIDSEFSLAGEPFDFGNGFSSDSSFEVTENGTYSVSVKDSRGRVVSTSVTVDTIDKESPVISAITKDTEDWSESGVNITVEASDQMSGLAGDAYSYNGGEFTSSNTYHVTSNGTVSVRVKDVAGNVTEDFIEIKNVGRDPVIVAREKAEAEERARREAEAKKAEEERLAAEKAALEKAEAERIAALEKEAAEKAAAEKAKTEKERKEKADIIKEKLKAEKEKAKEALEKEKREKEADKAKSAGMTASGNDISGNGLGKKGSDKDVSGNGSIKGFINVTDMTDGGANGGASDALKDASKSSRSVGEVIESISEFSTNLTEDLPVVVASVGTLTLKAGMAFLGISIIFFSFFNYIYVSENGHAKLITLAKISKSKNGKKVTVSIKKNRLKEHGRYCIYFCPWNRIGLKNKEVTVVIEGEETPIFTDERTTFMY